VTIRWEGNYYGTYYYVKARLKVSGWDWAESYDIKIDFNNAMFGSKWSIATKNLVDVKTYKCDDRNADFVDAVNRGVNAGEHIEQRD